MRLAPWLLASLVAACGDVKPHSDAIGLAGASGAAGAGSGAGGAPQGAGGIGVGGVGGAIAGGGSAPTACVPGQSVSCACSSGDMGAQVCRLDGGGFEPCQCQSTGAGGAGTGGTGTGASGCGGAASAGAAGATVSAACKAYGDCLNSSCGAKSEKCYGDGGLCADYFSCLNGCCGDTSCINACGPKYTSECATCLSGYSQCVSQSCTSESAACTQSSLTCLKQAAPAPQVDPSKCIDVAPGMATYDKWCSASCGTPPKAKVCSGGAAPSGDCVGLTSVEGMAPAIYCCP